MVACLAAHCIISRMSSEAQNRRRAWILFALLLVAAGAVRFTDLGLSPFRADTINFYQHALNHDRPLDLWKNPPWPEHIPLAETIMLWFHQALDIQPTHFSVRFPFALMGTLTMIGLFFFVRRAFDWPTALAALLPCVSRFFRLCLALSFRLSFFLSFSLPRRPSSVFLLPLSSFSFPSFPPFPVFRFPCAFFPSPCPSSLTPSSLNLDSVV